MRETLRKSLRRERRTSQHTLRNERADSASGSSRENQGMGRKSIEEWRQRCSSGIPSSINSPSFASTPLETLNPSYKHHYLDEIQHLKAEGERLALDLTKAKVESQYSRAENEHLVLEAEEAKNEIQELAAEIVRLKRESEEAKKVPEQPRTEEDFKRRSWQRRWRIIHGVLQLDLNISRKRRKAPPPPITVPDPCAFCRNS